MILIVNVFMRTVPDYATTTAETVDPGATPPSPSPSASPSTAIPLAEQSDSLVLRSSVEILDTAFMVAGVVLVLLILAGAAAAWFISGRVLKPLQAINTAAQIASTGSFDHRVGHTGPRDEVKDLSDTFDDMLGRLDSAFQAHRRFAANASHELRTPLAMTQTMLEVALADPHISADELREVTGRVLETNNRNTETVAALLDLAEISQRPLNAEPVSAKALLLEALSVTASESAQRNIDVHSELREVEVLGDGTLLRQAFTNLLTNAVRHNVEGGMISATLHVHLGNACVRIENSGPELSAERIEQLAEPFARGTGRAVSQGEAVRGHGLGLAIVTNIIDVHDGVLELTPRAGGGLIAAITIRARNWA